MIPFEDVNGRAYFRASEKEIQRWLDQDFAVATTMILGTYVDIGVPKTSLGWPV